MNKPLLTAQSIVDHYPNEEDYNRLLSATLQDIDNQLLSAVQKDQNSLAVYYYGISFRKLGNDIHKSLTERGFKITPPCDNGLQRIWW